MKPFKLAFLVLSFLAFAFTIGCKKNNGNEAKSPSLSVTLVTSITKSKAVVTSSITSEGSSAVTEQGFVYDTVANPTLNSNKVKVDSTISGSFTFQLINLLASTKYYVRSYAINSVGTSYGEEASFNINPITVGEIYQGGTIVYIDASGKHGLIVARSTTSGSNVWGCTGTNVATSTDLGTGQANTNAILAACNDAGSAAKYCNDIVIDGYSDWFMPSRDELKLAYTMRETMQLSPATRLTSSQIDASSSWAVSISPVEGGQIAKLKTDTVLVRAFRDF